VRQDGNDSDGRSRHRPGTPSFPPRRPIGAGRHGKERPCHASGRAGSTCTASRFCAASGKIIIPQLSGNHRAWTNGRTR
jgi:hypothetical protein